MNPLDSSVKQAAQPMIDAVNVHKYFNNNHILKGVDLRVGKGEVVCVVGPSGSGKTTLLRCLCQLEQHEAGTITVSGREIGIEQHKGQLYRQRERDTARIRQRIGFVFQSFNLFPHMTALENVMYGPAKVLKENKQEVRERAERLLDQVGLSKKYNSYPSALSGGQQQRVAIARALAMQPDVILFDEPTSALDSESVGEVLQVMRSVAMSGITMVVVTHEIGFARDVADTLVLMEDGIVIERGPCHEVLDSPKTARAQEFFRR